MKNLRPWLVVLLCLAAGPSWSAPSDRNAAPPNPIFEAEMSRGDVLLAAGDDEGAERHYRNALQQAPAGEALADALHKLGIALGQQQRFKEAEPLIRSAEKIARQSGSGVLLADVLRAKTFVLYRTGRIDEARGAFREAKRVLERTADAWRTDGESTAWIHKPSGRSFPSNLGPFKRLRRTMLDDTGHNVVVHYRLGAAGWGAALVSVYLSVDRGVPLADEFRATKTEIARQYPDAVVLRDQSVTMSGTTGFMAVFRLPPSANGKIRQTSLSAFEIGRALLRVRASYPASEAEQRSGQVEDLTRALLSDRTGAVTRP